jgi:hypothetical protein
VAGAALADPAAAGAVAAAAVGGAVGGGVAGLLAGGEADRAAALLACPVGAAADGDEQPVSAIAARAAVAGTATRSGVAARRAMAADRVAVFMSWSLPGAGVTAVGGSQDRPANNFGRQ